ncbi:MAG: phenylacetic acid degradation operon negative regulatory protein [Arenicella sp.]|jgi:phenylacetic acid degradation operon negative regulatory protein
MLQKEITTVSPRALVMSLFNAPKTSTLTIGQLIKAGELFEIKAATLRMAVTRLINDKLVTSTERGVYHAGKNALKLNSEIKSWRTADKKTKRWSGDWLMAITNHLGRTNKTRLQSTARVLQIYGFVEIELGVWVRPSNLMQSLDKLHLKLVAIGLDSRAYLISVCKVAQEKQALWHSNWPISELKAGYDEMIDRLEKSLNRLANMGPQEAAKETLVVGESAIRLINLDPLLPTEIIDSAQFKKLVASMNEYDLVGHNCWQKFLSN